MYLEVIAGIGKNNGGTAMFMSDISSHLPNTGGSYGLLTMSESDECDLPIDGRFNVHKISSPKDTWLSTLTQKQVSRELSSFSDGQSIVLVHQHGIWLGVSRAAVAWATQNNLSLVVSPHGMLEPWALNHRKWKKRLAWCMYQKRDLQLATAFHACSKQEADNIRKLGFKQPIAVIPNGVELPDLGSGGSVEIDEQEAETKTALFLSRIHPKKGLLMLVDAWKALSPECWRLVIAGNDNEGHSQELSERIESLGLTEEVSYVGPLFGSEKEQAYRDADLFVLPSYSENFGIVVTEALGYNLPVLTTTGCPWQELRIHDCGWWVDPTPVSVLDGLREALGTDRQRLREMGARGRQLVENNYQWPGIADRMNAFYEWLQDGGNQPDFVI